VNLHPLEEKYGCKVKILPLKRTSTKAKKYTFCVSWVSS